jgi:hypothetical protein
MARYGLSDQTMEFAVATALASDGLLTGIPAVTEPNMLDSACYSSLRSTDLTVSIRRR